MTSTLNPIRTADQAVEPSLPTRVGMHIEVREVSRVLPNGARTLTDVSLSIEPGEVVAVIGPSGAGKSTLLETIAGVRAPSTGGVRLDGWDVHRHPEMLRTAVGYVPQDDIIHRDLAVRATLRYAARLRLAGRTDVALDQAVDHTLASLGLRDRADTAVARLSGGQRKRVSIAVELLTRPRAFFLDEPTSGLDPGTARSLMASLRDLAADGSTIVLTTHSPDDVRQCDRVVVLAPGGRLAFDGPPAEALERFGVDDIAQIYGALDAVPPSGPAPRPPAVTVEPAAPPVDRQDARARSARVSCLRQWAVLCRRNLAVLSRNRLTLAIMLAAPALVIAMFVMLFRPGTFDAAHGDALASVGITYWLAFAAFFFGLTYGLLQVCTEAAIVRRERHVGMGLVAYVLAKVTVLVPVLLLVNVAMVVALRSTDRLPHTDAGTTVALLSILLLEAVAALALGLLASAAVSDPAQATLALPMLCFPAVLFGGAVLPVHAMAAVGRAIALGTADRWGLEALGRTLGLGTRYQQGSAGAAVLRQYGGAFTGGIVVQLAALAFFALLYLGGTVLVLRRRTAVG